ncbi:hypothetical protein QYF36_015299 [Acer negundo]|nr:hypothetical protein QYF36_015299 [Acer negundo]
MRIFSSHLLSSFFFFFATSSLLFPPPSLVFSSHRCLKPSSSSPPPIYSASSSSSLRLSCNQSSAMIDCFTVKACDLFFFFLVATDRQGLCNKMLATSSAYTMLHRPVSDLNP